MQHDFLALDEEQLIARGHEIADALDDDDARDAVHGLVDDLAERFCPEANRRALHAELEGEPGRARELGALLVGIENRAALRATAQQLGQL